MHPLLGYACLPLAFELASLAKDLPPSSVSPVCLVHLSVAGFARLTTTRMTGPVRPRSRGLTGYGSILWFGLFLPFHLKLCASGVGARRFPNDDKPLGLVESHGTRILLVDVHAKSVVCCFQVGQEFSADATALALWLNEETVNEVTRDCAKAIDNFSRLMNIAFGLGKQLFSHEFVIRSPKVGRDEVVCLDGGFQPHFTNAVDVMRCHFSNHRLCARSG